jgi:hypothetical protein
MVLFHLLTHRLADSVRTLADGTTAFVKPLEERMSMSAFLSKLSDKESAEILYLQSQDGNIHRAAPGARGEPELAALQGVVSRDIAWMKEATGKLKQTACRVQNWQNCANTSKQKAQQRQSTSGSGAAGPRRRSTTTRMRTSTMS